MQKNIPKIVFVVGVLAIIFLFSRTPSQTRTEPLGISRFGSEKAESDEFPKKNPFNEIVLKAKAAIVFDIVKGEPIFELNSRAQLPLASLTKIMTVTMAKEILPQADAEKMKMIFEAALVSSSNDAAQALASAGGSFLDGKEFIEIMNEKAKTLNLNQTYFLNPTGLDLSEQVAGAYGSAADVAKLIIYAAQKEPKLFEVTAYSNIDSFSNTNLYVASTTRLLASKTGFTDLAGGNLAVIFDAGFNHPVAVIVLGSSKSGRFSDTEKLIAATFKYLANF